MDRTFLDDLRRNSCYPTFRAFVGFGTGVGYLAAAGFALAGGLTGQVGTIAVSIGIAFVLGVLVNVLREVSLMLADIADATLASASSRREASSANYVSSQDLAALARRNSRP